MMILFYFNFKHNILRFVIFNLYENILVTSMLMYLMSFFTSLLYLITRRLNFHYAKYENPIIIKLPTKYSGNDSIIFCSEKI